MKTLLISAAALTVFFIFLVLSSGTDWAFFAEHYRWLRMSNNVVAIALVCLFFWQTGSLWREYRGQVFGARLKSRLLLMFSLMAVAPAVLVYVVSVQFVTRSIETWFDVRVEEALKAGLNLGQSALDYLSSDLLEKGHNIAGKLAGKSDLIRRTSLELEREQYGVQSAALFSITDGRLLASTSIGTINLRPPQPTAEEIERARSERGFSVIIGDRGQEMALKVIVPVPALSLGVEPQVLQIYQPVPGILGHDADAVQSMYKDYQKLSLGRTELNHAYATTLTLILLLALIAGFALAILFARRLSAPLFILAEGTQAVAQGDYTPRATMSTRDELGILTQSFNRMTRQLTEARSITEKHRAEVESARAYLESILANLSAGVLVFDRRFILRTANDSTHQILKDDFIGLIDETIEAWPRQIDIGRVIRDQFADREDNDWQTQVELRHTDGMPQFLLLRGSHLPRESGGGYVVVFDDVTQLIAAQRSAAWGEVARRLAHEIKNPLTPIQLSAERLQMKLYEHLDATNSALLMRSTQTIINQVHALKRMVDDFRNYARLPPPELVSIDFNNLIREVLALYETSSAKITAELADNLPQVLGDATQLRQIIHNLLQNSEDALEGEPSAKITLCTLLKEGRIELIIADNGTGFPLDILPRIFEPYVTTKQRGTGLGLAIVKKIVDEHHGQIEVRNQQPRGAWVGIRLLAAPATH